MTRDMRESSAKKCTGWKDKFYHESSSYQDSIVNDGNETQEVTEKVTLLKPNSSFQSSVYEVSFNLDFFQKFLLKKDSETRTQWSSKLICFLLQLHNSKSFPESKWIFFLFLLKKKIKSRYINKSAQFF